MEIRKERRLLTRVVLRGLVWPLLWQKQLRDWIRPPRPPSRPPSRIAVFVSMELLGGGIMISAILKTLRQVYPKARIYVVGEPHRAGKLEWFYKAHSWADEMIYCPVRGGSRWRDWWRFYRTLKTYQLDMCVLSPNHSCANSVFLYLLGIPRITGAYLPDSWPWHGYVEHRFLTDRMTTEHIGTMPYRVLYFPQAYAKWLMRRPDARIAELVPYVRYKEQRVPALMTRKPIVTMHPGGPPKKRWRPDGYASIGQRLVERYDAAIVLIGGAPEAELAEQIKTHILRECPGADVFNSCGASTDETLTCIAQSTLYVGNNAGPLHFAVALGTPVIAVFRGKDRWFSGPDAASDIHHVVWSETIDDVSVSEVWDTIDVHWRGTRIATPA
jgi:ADP-heptose:LPS heptosyltransferase